MDLLSDVLRVVRLDSAFFYRVEAGRDWRVEAAAARELTPRVIPDSEHLISYHILIAGRCFGGLSGKEQVEMTAGDVIVFPHGDAHVMSAERDRLPSRDVVTSVPARYADTVFLDSEPRETLFVCGFLGCDKRPFNPLIAGLPRMLHMRGMSTEWIGRFARQLTDESRLGLPGADSVLVRLAELMFIEVLRRYVDELSPDQTGWLAGLRDEVVGKALTLMHSQPSHGWTLEDLARKSNSSRTNLAKRFTALVGQPPMQYLAQWRMQVAASLLGQSGAKVATIGEEVGYDSEAAFSRAFKKASGVAPGAWRDARRLAPV
jgi:AraC-like DNA-binding protein